MVRRPVTSARKDSCVTGSTGMTVPRKVISGNSSVRRNSRRIWPSRSPLPVVIERASIRTITSAENVPSCSRSSACAETSGARPAKPPRLSLTKNVTRLAPPSNVNEPVGSNDSVDATSRPVVQRRARITFLPTPLVSQLFHATSRKMRPRAPTYPPDPRPPTMLRRLLSTLGDTETRRRAARSLAVLCGIGYALTIVVMAGTGLGLLVRSVIMPRNATPVQQAKAREGAVAVLERVGGRSADIAAAALHGLAAVERWVTHLASWSQAAAAGNIQARWADVRALVGLAVATEVLIAAYEDGTGNRFAPGSLHGGAAVAYLETCLDFCDQLALDVDTVPWTEPGLRLDADPSLRDQTRAAWKAFSETPSPALAARKAFVDTLLARTS